MTNFGKEIAYITQPVMLERTRHKLWRPHRDGVSIPTKCFVKLAIGFRDSTISHTRGGLNMGVIHVTQEHHVSVVTIDDAERYNAMSLSMWIELEKSL
jgi:hypothetical protein